ncbi:MAG: hypothetical protein HY301_06290 [Verrucomicrobia bacterium]|nr:hypothetical protein [Verrucomicrobiota bacterium]
MTTTPTSNPSQVGKFLLAGLLFVMFLVMTVTPIGLIVQSGEGFFSTPEHRTLMAISFASTVVFGTLGYLMWQGFGWARWVTTLTLFAAGLFTMTYLEEFKGEIHTAMIWMVLFCIALAAVMAFAKPIEDFIRRQERTRRMNA